MCYCKPFDTCEGIKKKHLINEHRYVPHCTQLRTYHNVDSIWHIQVKVRCAFFGTRCRTYKKDIDPYLNVYNYSVNLFTFQNGHFRLISVQLHSQLSRLATSRPLGERSEPFLAAKRYEIRRRTFLKVYQLREAHLALAIPRLNVFQDYLTTGTCLRKLLESGSPLHTETTDFFFGKNYVVI